jgi:hypothetical protein
VQFCSKHYIQNYGSFGASQNNNADLDTHKNGLVLYNLGWQILNSLVLEVQFSLK